MSRRDKEGLGFFRRLVVTAVSAVVTLFVIGLIAVAGAVFLVNGPGPQAKTGAQTTVILRSGASLNEIAAALQTAGVVRSSALFAAAAQVTGQARKLKAGEYEFDSGASLSSVLGKIGRGEVVRHFVTIPEGRTAEMAVDILMAQPALTGVAPIPPEGSILPETYEVQRGEDRAAVLNRMTRARDALLDELWAQRDKGLPLKSPEEAVILASIVEKETGLAAERPKIARVFINRLEKGMRLQSDPTIIYGISRGRPLGRGIRQSELDADNPYNTYKIDGLTPTPIGNPGRAALAAVLDPPEGDWLYFVADGSGGHAFATTLEEHNANVVKWRQIEAQRAAAASKAP